MGDVTESEYLGLMNSHIIGINNTLGLKNCSLEDELDQVWNTIS